MIVLSINSGTPCILSKLNLNWLLYRQQPLYGQAMTPFQRLRPPHYYDGVMWPRVAFDGGPLASARDISNGFPNRESPNGQFTALLMAFGQFLDHDVAFTPMHGDENLPNGMSCCSENGTLNNEIFDKPSVCFPIKVRPDDPVHGGRQCMNLVRSLTTPRLDCYPSYAEQMNQITHWIDASSIYGSSDEVAKTLRTGSKGLLKVQQGELGHPVRLHVVTITSRLVGSPCIWSQ